MTTAKDVYRSKATPEEIEDLLEQVPKMTVATLNDDGTIHLANVISYFEDGKVFFEASSVTKKARNLTERSTISFLVEGAAKSTGRRFMASCEGTGRTITGDAAHAVNRRLRQQHIVEEALDLVHEAWGALDDVAVEITPNRWRSWVGDKLMEVTQAALGTEMSTNEIWK
jgi:hypothetical protein